MLQPESARRIAAWSVDVAADAGSLETGRLADLVVVHGDAINLIRRAAQEIAAVYKRGREAWRSIRPRTSCAWRGGRGWAANRDAGMRVNVRAAGWDLFRNKFTQKALDRFSAHTSGASEPPS